RGRLCAALICASTAALAVQDPSGNADYRAAAAVLDTGSVAVVHVTMAAADLAHMLTDVNTDIYYQCSIQFSNQLVAFETVSNVAIRLRGNTSRVATKKSYKLSFNEYVPGREFHGLRKLNLNGEHNDPSIMRSALCWSMFAQVAIPHSRAAYAELYINEQLFGLFANIEQVNDEFLKAWFGSDAGNLFKCLYLGAPADLTYRADGRYDLVGGGATYALETNEASNDFRDLAQFIALVNTSAIANLPAALEPLFNVEDFLRWMALSALCGSWDDYRYNANNYYLYHDRVAGRFQFIPYDYDNTLGVDWMGVNWGTRNLNSWDSSGNRPLSKRILQVPRYRRRYNQLLADFSATTFAPSNVSARAASIKALIQPAAERDYAGVAHDWGFDLADFNAALTAPAAYSTANHVTFGVLPFVSTRVAYVETQLDPRILCLNEVLSSNSTGIVDEGGRHVAWLELYNPRQTAVTLNGLHMTDNPTLPTKWALPATNVPARGYLLLWLDGHPERGALHAPFVVGTAPFLQLRIYTTNVLDQLQAPALSPDTSYGMYLDYGSAARTFAVPTPCAENLLLPAPPPALLINEFQADNKTTITNPANGSFDDWIELWNAGATTVDLLDLYLSDNAATPAKWRCPSSLPLAPGQHLLLWADGTPAYGPQHLSFKLSAGGEEILLVASDGSTVLDAVQFGAQAADISCGRYPDGAGGARSNAAFQTMQPTPGAANVPEPFATLLFFAILHHRCQARNP
ncbi:MAG: CotH kinase family protein, partial [bacterium]|nr:CotH kinase family protein [bacterium]